MLNNSRRMRSFGAALMCVLLLAGQASAQFALPGGGSPETRLKQVALSIPHGSPVQVQMKDKSRLNGRIGPVDNSGFELQYLDKGNIISRKIAFEEVQKLTPGPPKNRLQRMIAPVLAVVGLIGTAGALTAAIRK